MSSFSPKNEQSMIDCYQINYTTCQQMLLENPKLSSSQQHCSIPVDGNQRDSQRCGQPMTFVPGSSFRLISEPVNGRENGNHVYDMPHRRPHHGLRVSEVSDVAGHHLLVSMSSPSNVHVDDQLIQEGEEVHFANSRPMSSSPCHRDMSSCPEPDESNIICPPLSKYDVHSNVLPGIEFVHLFECTS